MTINWQRCFKIPKNKLQLFLVKLDFETGSKTNYQADYIFDEGEKYAVVVSETKYPNHVRRAEIHDFSVQLNNQED